MPAVAERMTQPPTPTPSPREISEDLPTDLAAAMFARDPAAVEPTESDPEAYSLEIEDEDVGDDATAPLDLASTPIADLEAWADEESAEEEATWRPDADLSAQLSGEFPTIQQAPAPLTEVPAPLAATSGGELEALLLETENLRLRRSLHEVQRQLAEAEKRAQGADARTKAAEATAADWRQSASAMEARLREAEWRAAHFEAFARANLWQRLRGCPPFTPPPSLKD